MIFQNNYNQRMEISPSCSAYHLEFVSNFLSKKIVNQGFKIEFPKKNLAKLINKIK